ncbi:MAG: TraB/GumN family protein [Minwuiales bacterium]|nr:TraB/GumN family protein [Minwuiales bacterium]
MKLAVFRSKLTGLVVLLGMTCAGAAAAWSASEDDVVTALATPDAPASTWGGLIERIQVALRALGYDAPEGPDGPGTEAAIRAFQRDFGHAPTGQASEALLAHIDWELTNGLEATGLMFGRGLLWRIEGGPSDRPNYLFGTVHFSDPRVLALPDAVREAFDAADTVALEVAGFEGLEADVAQSMVLNDGRTLDQIVGEALFADVSGALARHGFGTEELRAIRPWAVYVFLTLPSAELKRAARGIPYLDQWLEAEALRQNKQVVGLETMEQHLAVLTGLPEAVQLAVLRSAVDYAGKTDELQERLIQSYLERDMAAIQQSMVEPALQSDPTITRLFLDRLINLRNRKIVDRADELLREGGAFVAVGALHLPGRAGILRLLEKRGYRIERVY